MFDSTLSSTQKFWAGGSLRKEITTLTVYSKENQPISLTLAGNSKNHQLSH